MFREQLLVVGNEKLMRENSVKLDNYIKTESTQNILIGYGGILQGWIQVADVLREDSQLTIYDLKALKLRTILLTGDSDTIAKSIGSILQIDEIKSEKLPEQKLEEIKYLQQQGRLVAMVGDGINDAPALTEAYVGIAMGSGTDVTRECGDIVLLGDKLLKLVEVIKVAKRCRGIIYFNFLGTLIVDLIGVLLAAFGKINPTIAVLIHVFF